MTIVDFLRKASTKKDLKFDDTSSILISFQFLSQFSSNSLYGTAYLDLSMQNSRDHFNFISTFLQT